jgi:hypothetical protein
MKHAPWTEEEVIALNRYQDSGETHPFTCGNEHPPAGHSVLVATEDGWICPVPFCYYTQDWCHEWMIEAGTKSTSQEAASQEKE